MLELGPGFTAITGETGAGKTMVVTALGLLLGGRADSGAVRTGARAARVEGLRRPRCRGGERLARARRVRRSTQAGGELDDGRLVLARQVSAEGRSRAFAGGVSLPVSALSSLADPLVAVHGQSDQHRLLRPARPSATRSTASPGPAALALRARFEAGHAALLETERELAEVVSSARERAREADLLRFGLEEVGAVDPRPGEEETLAAEETRLGFADTPAQRGRAGAREPLRRGGPRRARSGLRRTQAPRRRARPRPRGGRARRPARGDQLPALGRGRRRGVVRLAVSRPTRLGSRPSRSGAAGAHRAHPEVRRRTSTRCSPGPRRRRLGCSSSTAPTSGSASCRRAGPAARRARRDRVCAVEPSGARPPPGSGRS